MTQKKLNQAKTQVRSQENLALNIQDVNQLYDIRISANERKSYKNSDSPAKLFSMNL